MFLFVGHIGCHYFLHCSDDQFSSLNELFVKYLGYMNTRIEKDWFSINIEDKQKPNMDKTEDIINDKLVRITSIEFCQVLRDIAIPKDGSNLANDPITSLFSYILQNSQLFGIYLTSTCKLLLKPDSDCKNITITILNYILPKIISKFIFFVIKKLI